MRKSSPGKASEMGGHLSVTVERSLLSANADLPNYASLISASNGIGSSDHIRTEEFP